jgi:glutamine synthetase
MTPTELKELVKKHNIKMIDAKFVDFLGQWKHLTYPIERLEEGIEEGFGFDGSSISGWRAINSSDMLMKPDPATAVLDPFLKTPTLSILCDVIDPITHEPYSRDPRSLAKRAVAYLKSTGIADTAYFGPEAEFFIFDSIQYSEDPNNSFFNIDSDEAGWNNRRTEANGNKGFKPPTKGGYCVAGPTDQLSDLRTQMVMVMQAVGIVIETHHHEVASAGQAEIDMKYDTLVKMADQILWYKHIVKNVARQHGKTATFMPKPLFGDNGSGMHTHQSLWKGGKPLFAGDAYAGMSEMALFYIGGLLKHAAAICAFANPTTNSYRRLVPGYEAPVNLAYSARNRSASIRIPMYSSSPKAKRLELRSPDPSCNPYLAFAAMMMAGLDGIENRIHPGEPLDKDIYSLSPEELAEVPTVPGSLDAALDALRKDRAFLMKGDVFSSDLIDAWIAYKSEAEADHVRLRPVPAEFQLYYDC